MADLERQPQEELQAPDTRSAPVSSVPPPPQGQWLPREEAIAEAVYSRFEARLEYREHQGPLPAPEDFGAYADKIPDGANRLMKMAEKEQDFQHERARRQEFRATFGVGSALVVVLAACALSAYGFSQKNPLEAAAIFGVTLASIIGTFIYGTSVRAKRETQKEESAAIEKVGSEEEE